MVWLQDLTLRRNQWTKQILQPSCCHLIFPFDKKSFMCEFTTYIQPSYTFVILLLHSMKQTELRWTQKLSLNLEFQSFHFYAIYISVTLQIQTKDKPSSNRHYRLTICQSIIAKPTIVNHSFLHAVVNHLKKIFTFSSVLAVDAFLRVGQIAVKS